MSDFHYVRTLGTDGGVDVCSGPAIGLDLASVLADGLPPFNIALQLIAGLCEILDIAEEDQEVHGNIELDNVFVDDTGAVSLEAFGQPRTRAPEGKPKGHATDLYGLGYVAFRLLSGLPFPEIPADDADAHDDAVIDAVLLVDLGRLNETMVGDVQWFLAKLLAFDREDRPSAVECWRTFVAFAGEVRGPDFVQWCLDALDGGGERRQAGPGMGETPRPAPEASLDGPMMSKGPLQRGGLSFDNAAVAGGTAFFTKEEMKAALESDAAVQAFKPAAGGGSATSYWTRDQLQAMATGNQEAPRPKRAVGEGERRKTLAISRSAVQEAQRVQSSQDEAAPRPAPGRAPAAPAPRPPAQPGSAGRSPAGGASGRGSPAPPFAHELGSADPFEQAEPTIRMKAPSVRTTRTPAPAPQVHRPPRAVRPPDTTFEPSPERGSPAELAGEETVLQKLSDIEGFGPSSSGPSEPPRPPPQVPPRLDRGEPIRPPVPAYEPPTQVQDEGGSGGLMLGAAILVLVVVSLVACMGLGGMGAAVAWVSGAGSSATVQPAGPRPSATTLPTPVRPEPAEVDPDAATPQPGDDVGAPSPSPSPQPARPSPQPARPSPQPARPSPQPARPSPQPARPSPQPARPSPQPAPPPSRPPPAPPPRPAPAAVAEPAPDAPVTLSLRSSGRGRLNCPGVDAKAFDGNTTLTIEAYQLPATCMVEMDKKRAAFQVFNTGTITCNLAGTQVSCDRTSVP